MFKAVEPNVVNHNKARIAGEINTPAINSRIVLPLEILAINSPIKGAHDICHAQKKIVLAPNHSLSLYGVNVRLILRKLVTYPPMVVTKFSRMKIVGPIIRTNNKSIPATTILILLNILIPLSRPVALEIMKQTVTIAMITICVQILFGIVVK